MKNIWNKFKYYISDFHTIWVIFSILIGAGVLAALRNWNAAKYVFLFALVFFLVFVTIKPMNAVYGLNGTSGNISKFICLVIVFNVIFSSIYYLGFLMNAGISYDINQPYVSYGMFYNAPCDSTTKAVVLQHEVKSKTTEAKSYYISKKELSSGKVQYDTLIFVSPATPTSHYYDEEHLYNRIRWVKVLQNTLMTSLMQEPTDLFSCCSVYNNINNPQEQNLNGYIDEESCRFFTWILLVQVFISWIFFGVFISILYNKFRYES